MIATNVCCALGLALAVTVQPGATKDKATPISIDPITPLGEAARFYRAGPIAERISVSIRQGTRPPRKSDFVLKLDPGKAPDGSAARLRLELANLRVFMAGGTLSAAAVTPGTPLWQTTYTPPLTGASLAECLPPLPLPQLALLNFDPTSTVVDITPYAPRVVWTGATLDPTDGRAFCVINGDSTVGPVKLTTDGATGRLRSLTTTHTQASVVMEITFAPAEVGDPSTWPIDATGRPRAASLASVMAQAGDIAVGAPWPAGLLRLKSGEPWVAAPAEAGAPAPRTVLVLLREPTAKVGEPSRPTLALGKAAQEAITRANLGTQASVRFAVCFDASALSPAAAGEHLAGLEGPLGPNLLWSAGYKAGMGRLAGEPTGAIVVVEGGGTISAIIQLDGREKDAEGLAAELRDGLK